MVFTRQTCESKMTKIGDLVTYKSKKSHLPPRRGIVTGRVRSHSDDVWVMWTDETHRKWEYEPYLEVISESR